MLLKNAQFNVNADKAKILQEILKVFGDGFEFSVTDSNPTAFNIISATSKPVRNSEWTKESMTIQQKNATVTSFEVTLAGVLSAITVTYEKAVDSEIIIIKRPYSILKIIFDHLP